MGGGAVVVAGRGGTARVCLPSLSFSLARALFLSLSNHHCAHPRLPPEYQHVPNSVVAEARRDLVASIR